MKKALLTLAALAVAGVSSFAADGFVTFSNFTTPMVNDSNAGKVLDSSWTVGLFVGNQVSNDAAVPVATTTIFGAGTQADPATGLFQYSGSDVDLPGTTPNTTAVLTVKAWKGGATFASASNRGAVSFTSLPLGGVNPTPPPPSFTAPALDNMPVLHTANVVPEPTSLALGALGIGALALIRRRK